MRSLVNTLALSITFLAIVPLLGLLVGLIDPTKNPFIPVTPSFTALFQQSRIFYFMVNTAGLGGIVTILALLLGVWLAWGEQRYDYRGRKVLAVLSLLPMAVPSYITASTLRYSLSPGSWLGEQLGLPIFVGFLPAVIVLTLVTTPYVHLLISAALNRASLAEEEAARSLGCSRWRLFRLVIMPNLRPAIAFSGLLTLLYVISDFGSVAILDTQVLTWRLYQAVEHQQLAQATLLGVVILLLAMPIVMIARWIHTQLSRPQVSNPRMPVRLPLVGWRLVLMYVLHGVVIVLGLGLPAWTLVEWCIGGWLNQLTFASLQQPIMDTLAVGLVGTFITVAAGFLPAWVAARGPNWLGRLIEHGVYITSALPGILLAFGLLLAALLTSRKLGFGGSLYQSLLQSGILLMLGYLMHFIAKAYAGLKTSILLIDQRLLESAKVLGATQVRWLQKVVLPTLLPGIATAFILVFLAIIKELPVTLLLGNAVGIRTLSFRIFDRYQDAFLHDAGLAGLMLLVLSLAIMLLTLRWRHHV